MKKGIYKHSEERLQKMRIAQKGHPVSGETRKKISIAHTGMKHSKNSIRKMSIAQKKIGNRPPTMLGKKFTPEHRKKISEARKKFGSPWLIGKKQRLETVEKRRKSLPKGETHPWWKGGITEESVKIRGSFEYMLWRKSVFERDNYTCIWCGIRSGDGNGKTVVLNADHIKPFALFPELRFAIDNGRTLCFSCHKKTDSFGWKLYHNR